MLVLSVELDRQVAQDRGGSSKSPRAVAGRLSEEAGEDGEALLSVGGCIVDRRV